MAGAQARRCYIYRHDRLASSTRISIRGGLDLQVTTALALSTVEARPVGPLLSLALCDAVGPLGRVPRGVWRPTAAASRRGVEAGALGTTHVHGCDVVGHCWRLTASNGRSVELKEYKSRQKMARAGQIGGRSGERAQNSAAIFRGEPMG
jgi:hypothetical protein